MNFEEEIKKAQQDMARLQRDLIGVQYILSYLQQKQKEEQDAIRTETVGDS